MRGSAWESEPLVWMGGRGGRPLKLVQGKRDQSIMNGGRGELFDWMAGIGVWDQGDDWTAMILCVWCTEPSDKHVLSACACARVGTRSWVWFTDIIILFMLLLPLLFNALSLPYLVPHPHHNSHIPSLCFF